MTAPPVWKLSIAICKARHSSFGSLLQAEYRSIIFALCYFHAALLERKKFGVGNLPAATSGIGWNMNYPFNTGDLLCCGQCASNYLENNVKVCTVPFVSSCCGDLPFELAVIVIFERHSASSITTNLRVLTAMLCCRS